MSTVRDADGNVLNNPAPQVRGRYTDESALTQDWFTLHPQKSGLPSEADLDAIVKEQEIADATAGSNNDVSQVSVPNRSVVDGLVEGQEVPEPAIPSEQPTQDVADATPAGN